MRNVEDLMLQTMRVFVANATGIPTGSIWLQRPSEDFVGMPDGPNKPSGDVMSFPAVGINYVKPAKFEYNNYGETKYTTSASGTITTAYQPLGGLTLHLDVSLFAQTKADIRKYTVLLEMALLQNSLMGMVGDIIPGEYFRADLMTSVDLQDVFPYRRVFLIKTYGRILQEITNTTVTVVNTNAQLTTSPTGVYTTSTGIVTINPYTGVSTTGYYTNWNTALDKPMVSYATSGTIFYDN